MRLARQFSSITQAEESSAFRTCRMSRGRRSRENLSARRCKASRSFWTLSLKDARSSAEIVPSTARTIRSWPPSVRRRSMRSSPSSTRLTVASSLRWCSSCNFILSGACRIVPLFHYQHSARREFGQVLRCAAPNSAKDLRVAHETDHQQVVSPLPRQANDRFHFVACYDPGVQVHAVLGGHPAGVLLHLRVQMVLLLPLFHHFAHCRGKMGMDFNDGNHMQFGPIARR